MLIGQQQEVLLFRFWVLPPSLAAPLLAQCWRRGRLARVYGLEQIGDTRASQLRPYTLVLAVVYEWLRVAGALYEALQATS